MLNFKKYVILALVIFNFIFLNAQGETKTEEIDALRANLACQHDKTSQVYIKNKEKLNKLIAQSQIDYSTNARLIDIQRLIKEQKYNSALYEVNNLIENNLELSKAYEYLASIYLKTSKPLPDVVFYLKKALQADETNISATFRLAKVYLKEQKNIIGTEYLKKTVELANDNQYFDKIEQIILNNVHPQNAYEANNFYEVLGILYVKSGRNLDSYSAFTKALELNPQDIHVRYMLANVLYLDNQAQGALSLYESILKQNPSDSQIRASKAKLLAKNGKITDAAKEYQTILAQYPNSNQAKYGIYKIYKNSLSIDKIFVKIHNDNPNYKLNTEEISSFINFLNEIGDNEAVKLFNDYLGNVRKQQEELKIQLEQRRLEKIKEQQRLQQLQEQEKINKLKEQEKIKKELEQKKLEKQKVQKSLSQKSKQIEQIEPKNIEATAKPQNNIRQPEKERELLANIQKQAAIQSEQKEKLELEALKKNQQLALEKELQEQRIEEQKKIEKIEKQKKLDLKSIEQELQNAQKNNLKEYTQNKKAIDGYLNTKPITAPLYIAAANLFKQSKMPFNAIKYYNEAKKLEPLNSDIYYNIGLTYLELNRLEESSDNLKKAIDLNKDNKKAHTLLSFVNQKKATTIINNAYSNFEKKKYLEAFSTLDKGIKTLPDNAQLYYYRGLVEDAMKRNAAAIIDFNKAIEIDPGYYMTYYYLAKSYEKINDEKSALVSYERFLSTEPEEKDLVEEVEQKVIQLGKKYY